MVNHFGMIEWDEMRNSTDPQEFPEMVSWMRWQHAEPSITVLPSGQEISIDRGAEQGDVFGTVEASLTLGAARKTTVSRSGAPSDNFPRVCEQ